MTEFKLGNLSPSPGSKSIFLCDSEVISSSGPQFLLHRVRLLNWMVTTIPYCSKTSAMPNNRGSALQTNMHLSLKCELMMPPRSEDRAAKCY